MMMISFESNYITTPINFMKYLKKKNHKGLIEGIDMLHI